jgi:UDP-glucose 4-epimerase
MAGVTLVTGGAGYVGTHTAKDILDNTQDKVVVLDSFERSDRQFIDALQKKYGDRLAVREARLEDVDTVSEILREEKVTDVVHCAAYIDIPESRRPGGEDLYRRKILENGRNLIAAMKKSNVRRLVFSSTAATYGHPQPDKLDDYGRITEKHPLNPSTIYGKWKRECEKVFEAAVENGVLDSFTDFRYFNVAGADAEGLIGEAHLPWEGHVLPLIILRALGISDDFKIFGTKLGTRDGTPVRDLIHVSDIAKAHRMAIDKMRDGGITGVNAYNMGNVYPDKSMVGVTVRELVDMVRKLAPEYGLNPDFDVPETKELRSKGEPEILCASSDKICRELGWMPEYSLEDIVRTAIVWHKKLADMGWYAKHGIGNMPKKLPTDDLADGLRPKDTLKN